MKGNSSESHSEAKASERAKAPYPEQGILTLRLAARGRAGKASSSGDQRECSYV